MTNTEGTVHPDAQEQTQTSPPDVVTKGLRKSTPESIKTEQARRGIKALHGMGLQSAWQLAKNTAAAMGLNSTCIALLDILFMHSNMKDWTGKTDPVVWPSNQTLAKKLGKSIETVKKSLAILYKNGLIAYTDPHTTPRWGKRNEEGEIVEAHGISLSPYKTRHAVFYERVEDYTKKRDREHTARIKIRQLRTAIKIIINGGVRRNSDQGLQWQRFHARLDMISERKCADQFDMDAKIEDLTALHKEAEQALLDAEPSPDAPEETELETSLDRVGQPDADAETEQALLDAEPSPDASEETELETSIAGEDNSNDASAQPSPLKPMNLKLNLSTDLIFAAIPILKDIVPDARSWLDIKKQGETISIYSGIGIKIWARALRKLDADIATAMALLTAQKMQYGLVEKPAAYMSTLIQLAEKGELRLYPSYVALAEKALADELKRDPENTGFPLTGSIAWTRWSAITKENLPVDNLHVDVVSTAFRNWAKRKRIDLTMPSIEKTYIGFCRNWKSGNGQVH